MRLGPFACERQVPETEIVDETFDQSRRGGRKALQFRNAGIVACIGSVEKTIDTTGCSFPRAPSRKGPVREPSPVVVDRTLHVREAIEVIAIPQIKESRAPRFRFHAEEGYLCHPSSNSIR